MTGLESRSVGSAMSVGEICAVLAAIAAIVVALWSLFSMRQAHRLQQEASEGPQARLLDQQAQLLGRLDGLAQSSATMAGRVDELRRDVTVQLGTDRDRTEARLAHLDQTLATALTQLRQDNTRQLDELRQTVDQKLTTAINKQLSVSFAQISQQLEAVYRGLGDMQNLAGSVGDLKRVLSGVKTRGILGEVQLGALLEDILAPSQYLENAATKPGSRDRVEYAVKLPVAQGDPVLLPIDAKFPGDTYAALLDAYDTGDKSQIAAAKKHLQDRILSEAADIASKYVAPPHTTAFGVLFVPFEGLYAEVVSLPGLLETLQRTYNVVVTGPSTMAALINSLALSYQTFELQQRTDEVLRILQAVKAELPRYQEALVKAKRQIDTASNTVESIITTRTNVMERKLRSISLPTQDGSSSSSAGSDPFELEGEEA